jgi:hypothetical protein
MYIACRRELHVLHTSASYVHMIAADVHIIAIHVHITPIHVNVVHLVHNIPSEVHTCTSNRHCVHHSDWGSLSTRPADIVHNLPPQLAPRLECITLGAVPGYGHWLWVLISCILFCRPIFSYALKKQIQGRKWKNELSWSCGLSLLDHSKIATSVAAYTMWKHKCWFLNLLYYFKKFRIFILIFFPRPYIFSLLVF